MVTERLRLKQELIRQWLGHQITKAQVAEQLRVSRRTVERYRQRFLRDGAAGLHSRHTSHYHKLTRADTLRIVQAKKEGRHRSARWVRDHLRLRVHEKTVWRLFVKHGLNRLTLPPIKPITRFQARRANDLWQVDLMGKIRFPRIGYCHLIFLKDDRSRYLLAGSWVRRPRKIYVFASLYRALMRYGLPKAILCDRGSQFKSADPRGLSDFEEYVAGLGIRIIYGTRPRTKGKIERRSEVIQRDFVLEHLQDPPWRRSTTRGSGGSRRSTAASTPGCLGATPRLTTTTGRPDGAARPGSRSSCSTRSRGGSTSTPPSATTATATGSRPGT